jgi:hypothetical protein
MGDKATQNEVNMEGKKAIWWRPGEEWKKSAKGWGLVWVNMIATKGDDR